MEKEINNIDGLGKAVVYTPSKMKLNISPVQADIIFKALHYTCFNQDVEISEELKEIGRVLAEENPNETHIEDLVDVMEHLSGFIKGNEPYKEYFEGEEE